MSRRKRFRMSATAEVKKPDAVTSKAPDNSESLVKELVRFLFDREHCPIRELPRHLQDPGFLARAVYQGNLEIGRRSYCTIQTDLKVTNDPVTKKQIVHKQEAHRVEN